MISKPTSLQPQRVKSRRPRGCVLYTLIGLGIAAPFCCLCSLVTGPTLDVAGQILRLAEAIKTLSGIDLVGLLPFGLVKDIAIPFLRDLPGAMSAFLCYGCCGTPFIAFLAFIVHLILNGGQSATRQPQPPIPPPRPPGRF